MASVARVLLRQYYHVFAYVRQHPTFVNRRIHEELDIGRLFPEDVFRILRWHAPNIVAPIPAAMEPAM